MILIQAILSLFSMCIILKSIKDLENIFERTLNVEKIKLDMLASKF